MPDDATIFDAITSGDAGRVAALLDADPGLADARDAMGRSPARFAAYRGMSDVVALVEQHGARLDAWDAATLGRPDRLAELVAADPSLVTRHSDDGATLLHLAAFFGHPDLVEWLLAQGADANVLATPPFPPTLRPLHSAVAHRGAEAARRSARLLLDAGARANEEQEGGYTPLHQAAAHGDAELVRMLLDAGADPAAVAASGETPGRMARAKGFPQIAESLGA